MSAPTAGPFNLDFGLPIGRYGRLGERVSVVIDRQRRFWGSGRSAWVVIPAVRSDKICWLLVAADAEGERKGRETIAAFVGPTIGSLQPGRLSLSSAETVDRVLLDAGVRHAALLRSETGAEALLDAIDLMTAVRSGEPDLRRDIEDPIGFLLRDFHLALATGDPVRSERLLGRIEATGLLAGENLRFLHVVRLAKLARWHELRSLAWFADLARSRRPRNVTEYLLEALWRGEFDDAAALGQAGIPLMRFQERDLGTQFRSLLDSIDNPTSVGGRRLVWLWAVSTGNAARQERIAEGVDADERTLLDRLIGVGPASVSTASELLPVDLARAMADSGDFVGAVALAESLPGEPALVAIAVRAAFELSDESLAVRACALVGQLGESRLPTTPGFVRSLRDVRQLAANQCASWTDWLSRLAANLLWADAADVARRLSATWSRSELRSPATADAAANDLLNAADGVNALQVRAALDLVCDLASELADSVGAATFTDAALLVLSMQDNPSSAVRDAFFALSADVLSTGPGRSRYVDLVRTATTLWERVRSREAVTWVLDVADLFAANPSPDPSARAAFILSVATGVSDFASRLAAHERMLLEDLALECGTAVALPRLSETAAESAIDAWSFLSDKLVGLYSLLGGAGPRFAARVSALNSSARVEFNSDVVASDALRGLAQTADFLIIDTRHAAHAATIGIDSVRPRMRQLFPSGRGISSFIAVLREAVEREAATSAA